MSGEAPRRLRILMINHEFPPLGGGGGIVTYHLGREFVRRGHEVTLITSGFDRLPRFELVEGVRVHRLPALRRSRDVAKVYEMLSFVLSGSIWALRNVDKLKPDVVQVFFGIPSGPIAYLLKRVAGVPYVVFLGGRDVPRPNPDPPHYKYLYALLRPAIRAIWREAGAVVACSRGLKELALETDPTVDIRVIPDGIDLSRFRAPRRPIDPDPVRVLSIGRLIPRKGFHRLIAALPTVRRKAHKRFVLEIVGDGPMMGDLRRQAEELGVSDIVRFSGTVPYERLHERYESAHIFTLCSSAEGMPLVVLEAMATGLPVVASKVQGIEELVSDGVSGFLIDDPSDVEAIAEKLAELIDDGELRLRIGEEALRAVEKYDWSNIAERYLRIYKVVASKK
ncbi:glycosyltransferase family 4 protein [Candidatus Poribacteria bacterium]|nr:MAG: glycosyltransferase family 4 protein [Candidatus Poribacteria bacterium]